MVLDGKTSEEYSVHARVPEGSILGPTLFILYIDDLPDDFICNIAIYDDDTALCSKCDHASDLWQQLGGIQLSCLHLGGKGSIKIQTCANRANGLCQCDCSHTFFFNLVPSPYIS